jgi:heptosyltransferase-2
MNVEKILFIQTAFIGDAILSLPAIQKLRKIFPDSVINVLCIPESKEIFEASKFIDEVIVLDKKGKHRSILSTLKFGKELKEKKYTKVYSSHRSFRTALLVLSLRINDSFGFDNASLKHVYKTLVKYDINKHEVQRNLDLIGYNYDDVSWKILPQVQADEEAKKKTSDFRFKNKLENGFIAVAPGSVWNTKKYPQNYFEQVIEYYLGKNYNLVLIGGKSDKEICLNIKSKFEAVVDASGIFNIIESIELLRYASLLISNDSAPTHFGMCADVKVLTIYCSTIPGFGFYPYNSKSKFISFDELECKPCGIHGHKKCPINTFDCGIKLHPNKIIEITEGMLSEINY